MPSVEHHGRARKYRFLTLGAAGVALTMLGSTYAFADAAPEWADTETPIMDQNYRFAAIEQISEESVWAVGSTVGQQWNGTVAAHWDGKKWKETSAPEGLSFNAVTGLQTQSGEDTWAVGVDDSGSLTAHWDGKEWKKVKTPQPDVGTGQSPVLYGADVVESGTAWAVGCADSSDHTKGTAFAQQWDGEKWKLHDLPKPKGMKHTCLKSVETRAADEAYAVGRAYDGSKQGVPYIVHWNGEKWELAETPKFSQPDAELTGVLSPAVGLEGDELVYATGVSKQNYNDPVKVKSLLYVYDGKEWTEAKTPDTQGWIYGVGPCIQGVVCASGYTPDGKGILLAYSDGKMTQVDGPHADDVAAYMDVDADVDTGRTWVVGDLGASDEEMRGMASHTK